MVSCKYFSFLVLFCFFTQFIYCAEDEHGDTQLEKMLRARPNMLLGKETSHEALGELREVICKLFEGSSAGVKIYWNDEEPSLYGAHIVPTRNRDASIMVRSVELNSEGVSVPGEHQWAAAIFELHNVEGWKNFLDLQIDVILNPISEAEFLKRLARIEYAALEKLAVFYKDKWLPFAKEKKMSTNPRYWLRTHPEGFEEWFSMYNESDSYFESSKANYQYIIENTARMPEEYKDIEKLRSAYYPIVEKAID